MMLGEKLALTPALLDFKISKPRARLIS